MILIADGFNYKILNFDYEGVARNKKSKKFTRNINL